MHRENVGAAKQFVLLDPLDALLGGLLGGQILAPGDRLHAEGEPDPGDRAAAAAGAQEADRLPRHASPDAGLPAARAHELMILGDAPGRAENEAPGEFRGVFIAAGPWSANGA